MAIVNKYSGFNLTSTTENQNADRDSDFGEYKTRSLIDINNQSSSAIVNTYQENYVSRFGSSSNFSLNEQKLVNSMINESIFINGITVRYMPRHSEYIDDVWNERPESTFNRGYQINVLLESAEGFEGEGDIMTQYGIEFREEVILNMGIDRFDELQSNFMNNATPEEQEAFKRKRPLEGDLIVIPFGRTSMHERGYIPKVFEILRVTTYHDGTFFQLGDNYQYKLRCRLFELSGEKLGFAPTVIEDGKTIISGDVGKIKESNEGLQDSEIYNIVHIDVDLADTYAKNKEIEEVSKEIPVYKDGKQLKEKPKVMTRDYGSKAFGLPGIINNLDDI
jgi:hypothetical protein